MRSGESNGNGSCSAPLQVLIPVYVVETTHSSQYVDIRPGTYGRSTVQLYRAIPRNTVRTRGMLLVLSKYTGGNTFEHFELILYSTGTVRAFKISFHQSHIAPL